MKVWISWDALKRGTILEVNSIGGPDATGAIKIPSLWPAQDEPTVIPWGWHLTKEEAVGVALRKRMVKIAELESKIESLNAMSFKVEPAIDWKKVGIKK